MGRRKVAEGELQKLLDELEASEATSVDVKELSVEGWYHVTWDEPGMPVRAPEHHADRVSRIVFTALAVMGVVLVILFFSACTAATVG